MEKRKGIDLSVHNGNVDMGQIKSDGIEFVMLRAGYGRELSQKDKQFESNYAKAKAAGIPVGAYWYSYTMDSAGALLEAECCAQVLAGKQFEYPIAFDLEDNSQKSLSREILTDIAVTFCSKLEEYGYYTMLYASLDWMRNKLIYERIKPYALWLAQWSAKPTYENPIGIWQYASDGIVAGSSSRTDMNLSYQDYAAIIPQMGKNGFSGGGQPPAPQPPTPGELPEPARTLRRGDQGDDVKWIQRQLMRIGYGIGSGGIDGIFGSSTEQAVRQLQQANGLTADGIVGSDTRNVLKGGLPYGQPTESLAQGSSGDGVRWIQLMLTQQGYSVGTNGVDGQFGASTRDAVLRFQRDNGLQADGVVGANTRTALSGKNPFSEPRQTVQMGSTGEPAKWVQWKLRHIGYSIGTTGIDGTFGGVTREAVKQFQRAKALAADGIVGSSTRAALSAM